MESVTLHAAVPAIPVPREPSAQRLTAGARGSTARRRAAKAAPRRNSATPAARDVRPLQGDLWPRPSRCVVRSGAGSRGSCLSVGAGSRTHRVKMAGRVSELVRQGRTALPLSRAPARLAAAYPPRGSSVSFPPAPPLPLPAGGVPGGDAALARGRTGCTHGPQAPSGARGVQVLLAVTPPRCRSPWGHRARVRCVPRCPEVFGAWGPKTVSLPLLFFLSKKQVKIKSWCFPNSPSHPRLSESGPTLRKRMPSLFLLLVLEPQ